MDPLDALVSLGVALGLGLLVGLQRELAETRLAGFRTFALITVLGAACALVGQQVPAAAPWVLGAGLLALAAATAVGNWIAVTTGKAREPGITTEISVLLMFLVGAMTVVLPTTVAIPVGVGVAVLLQAKERLHSIAAKLGEKDMRAVLLFAALTFIVLPVLPDEPYGPYGVWNPRAIWLMVVLVVGMSLGGYIAYKFAGARMGTALAGLIGGLISSTAVTLSFSRRAGEARGAAGAGIGRAATLAIALASCVVYARVAVEIAIAGPTLLPVAAAPLGVMLVVSLAAAGAVYLRQKDRDEALPDQTNPTELRSALVFGGLFALVLLATAWAQDKFGGGGLYTIAAISGVHDMDAITLSTARLAEGGEVDPGTAWRAIVVAAISNMAFKAIIAGSFGGWGLLARVAAVFAPSATVGLLCVLFWPDGGPAPRP